LSREPRVTPVAALSALAARTCGVYRLTSVAESHEQLLRAALLWAGTGTAATGRSAAVLVGLDGIRAEKPELATPYAVHARSERVVAHRADASSMMIRRVRGIPMTGIEHTMLRLAATPDPQAFEIAFEDARRRRLTSVPAVRAYLDRFGGRGRPGTARVRRVLDAVDPRVPARFALEVRTRRLLVEAGLTTFEREFPLTWGGRTYRYDFAFPAERVILETNGRRWHDDATDYERDQEKWSVPGRLGYRLVLATWTKATDRPQALISELRATLDG